MANIDIRGLLGGKRINRCAAEARWRFPYYFLLSNAYARIELDYEAIALHFVSFRGSAPTAEEIESDFKEYIANHLIFVYQAHGEVWGQWDCRREQTVRHKDASSKRSPHPSEAEYQEWLKEQHPENWKLYHWNQGAAEILKFVYLLKAGPSCKIGIADDVEARVKQLQSGCPETIEILGRWPHAQARKKERCLHTHFKNKRKNGEWFALDQDDIQFIVASMRAV